MNTKLLSLLSATAALVVSSGLVTSAEAKPVSTSSQQQTLLAQGKKPNLNLTEEQKAKMKEIRQAAKAQMETVLTAEQREQMRAARESGEKRRGGWAALNLTEEQKARMKEIRQATQQQIDAILTPEQRQQMQEFRQNRQSRRQNRQAQ